MSRIGKKPVSIPSNVKVNVANRVVTVESGSKKLSMTHHPMVNVAWSESEKAVNVGIDDSLNDNRQARALWGTTRALINTMVQGVTKGFEKNLEVNGVGWGATVSGQNLDVKVGYANTIRVPIPVGVEVVVDKGTLIKIKGADKQAVGQFAAVVRSKRKPEPYNGKGIKYTEETIRRKQGKAFGA